MMTSHKIDPKKRPTKSPADQGTSIFGNILEHGDTIRTARCMTPRWPPSLCVCTINRFKTSLWDESLFSELPAGVCTSNAHTSTDLYAQAQMQKVYKSTRPHIKHKEPLSDILNRWGCIPKHKCTVKRLLSEAELSKKKKKKTSELQDYSLSFPFTLSAGQREKEVQHWEAFVRL